jgi:hypothetical protein
VSCVLFGHQDGDMGLGAEPAQLAKIEAASVGFSPEDSSSISTSRGIHMSARASSNSRGSAAASCPATWVGL